MATIIPYRDFDSQDPSTGVLAHLPGGTYTSTMDNRPLRRIHENILCLESYVENSITLSEATGEFFVDTDRSTSGDISGVSFKSRDAGDNDTVYGRVFSESVDVTDGSEDGALHLSVMDNGTQKEKAIITTSAFRLQDIESIDLQSSDNAEADVGTSLRFRARDSAHGEVTYGQILAHIEDNDSSGPAGGVLVKVKTAGSSNLQNGLFVHPDGVDVYEDLSVSGSVTLLRSPTLNEHATTKEYVDARVVGITRTDYDALSTRDATTLYIIIGA